MNENELMIGDWIKVIPFHNEDKSYYKRIENGRDIDNVFDFQGHIEPIELTEDILLRSFKPCRTYDGTVYEYVINNTYSVSIEECNNCFNASIRLVDDWRELGCCDIKYVHQLQNAVKLMTGLDLEIKL